MEGLHKAAGGGGDVEGGGALSDEVRRRAVADEVAAPLTHAHWALHVECRASSCRLDVESRGTSLAPCPATSCVCVCVWRHEPDLASRRAAGFALASGVAGRRRGSECCAYSAPRRPG